MLIEENHYYPYGLLMEGVTPESSVNGLINKYKYSNQELQLDLNLNQYHLGARFYDPVTGRFNVIDPLADFASSISSYHYAFNNPLIYNDPNGLYPDRDDYDYFQSENNEGDMRIVNFPDNAVMIYADRFILEEIGEPARDFLAFQDYEQDDLENSGNLQDQEKAIKKEWLTEAGYKSKPAPGWKHDYDPKAWGQNGQGLYFRWKEIPIIFNQPIQGSRIEFPAGDNTWHDVFDSLFQNLIEPLYWENDTLKFRPR